MIKNNLRDIRMREYVMDSGQFAGYLDIDFRTYSNWETNRSRPNLETALIIAKKLNKNIEDIWCLK